jgi:hypothetical protein
LKDVPTPTHSNDSERIGAFAQDCEITAIAEHTASPAPGHLFDDSEPLEVGERGVDRRHREPRLLDKLSGGQKRVLLKKLVDTQRRVGAVALRRDPVAVRLEQVDDTCCSVEGLVGCFRDAVEEKRYLSNWLLA